MTEAHALLTFDEARQIVASQLLPQFPKGLGEPVVRETGEESSRYFRVHVDLADGDPLMDPPVILVEKVTGHVQTLPWNAMLHPGPRGRETMWRPVSA